jgi:hypothetical protein
MVIDMKYISLGGWDASCCAMTICREVIPSIATTTTRKIVVAIDGITSLHEVHNSKKI